MKQTIRGAFLLLAFCLAGLLLGACKRSPDPRLLPETYCQPLSKSVGGLIVYPNVSNLSGPKKTISRFDEYKTAAGFKMRIPAGVGGLGHPNTRCELDEGAFHFVWFDGQLLPYVDWVRGKNRTEGVHVRYYVRFAQPSGKRHVHPQWKLEDAFKVPGFDKVWLLPFGNSTAPQYIPTDRKDLAKWRPAMLFEEAKDFDGVSVIFTCSYLRLAEVDGVVQFNMRYENEGTWCSGNPVFASGAVGRLDISSSAFMVDAAPIVRALVKELNSYIVKE